MDWTQAITIMGVLGGFIFWQVNRIHDDISGINRRLDGHAQRIDQLYSMFIDLLKEKK
jgi:hypothetical protein